MAHILVTLDHFDGITIDTTGAPWPPAGTD
jgi:hypothetical protein